MSDYTQLSFEIEPEIWKPIPGYEGLYEVSDIGRVRRLPNTPGCRNGRIIAQSIATTGYPKVGLNSKNKTCPYCVHYLVTLAFLGTRPTGYDVNHRNGTKTDNRLANLEYVTRSQNVQHAYDVLKHEAVHGEAHYRAKLTEQDIREIRQLVKTNTIESVASQFGVSCAGIHAIKTRKHWKHVSD